MNKEDSGTDTWSSRRHGGLFHQGSSLAALLIDRWKAPCWPLVGLPSLTGWQVCVCVCVFSFCCVNGTSFLHICEEYKSARVIPRRIHLPFQQVGSTFRSRAMQAGEHHHECLSAFAAQVLEGGAILVPT